MQLKTWKQALVVSPPGVAPPQLVHDSADDAQWVDQTGERESARERERETDREKERQRERERERERERYIYIYIYIHIYVCMYI
jgi:hypothetical protein